MIEFQNLEYPTIEQVNNANLEQLDYWYRHLPSPGYSIKDGGDFEKLLEKELPIMDYIFCRLKDLGGFHSELICDE